MKIVTIGGGTGGSIVDEALASKYSDLVSVVTSFDNGGSSGILRKEFGSLPHGDIRRRIFAQKTIDNKTLEDLYSYRFPSDEKNENFLERHSLGNLMILAATKIWGEKEGIRKVCELFKIKGKVLPVTYDFADLAARLSTGITIFGEDLIGQTFIDKRIVLKGDDRKIEKVCLTKETKINPEVTKEILSADYIVLCPGDFYGSLICNFLVTGFKEAIQNSKAKIVYFPNIMTKAAETKGYALSDFVDTLEKYLLKRVDYILFNSLKPASKVLNKYYEDEGAEFVINDLKGIDSRIIEVPLLKVNGHIRHDKRLVLKAIQKVFEIENQEKLYIFDLDDTIISTTPHRDQFINKDFKNLKLFTELKKLFPIIRKKNILLITYDQHGVQRAKIRKLELGKYFSKIIIVDSLLDKHKVIEKMKKIYKNKNIYVVGDRHEAELASAKKLGLKTICVAFDGNKYVNKNLHYLYDIVLEKESDFRKIL